MFLLSFIPDALIQLVVNGVLIAGIIGCVVSFFFGFFVRWMPWIIPYRMLLQIVGLVLLIVGVYFKGGVGVEMEWRERVQKAQAAVKLAEEKAKEANVALEAEKKKKRQRLPTPPPSPLQSNSEEQNSSEEEESRDDRIQRMVEMYLDRKQKQSKLASTRHPQLSSRNSYGDVMFV